MIIKHHFHKKDFALGLLLKQRLAASRKWPIAICDKRQLGHAGKANVLDFQNEVNFKKLATRKIDNCLYTPTPKAQKERSCQSYSASHIARRANRSFHYPRECLVNSVRSRGEQ